MAKNRNDYLALGLQMFLAGNHRPVGVTSWQEKATLEGYDTAARENIEANARLDAQHTDSATRVHRSPRSVVPRVVIEHINALYRELEKSAGTTRGYRLERKIHTLSARHGVS